MDIQTAIQVLLEANPADIRIHASQDNLIKLVKHLKSVTSQQRTSDQALDLLEAVVKSLPQLWIFAKAQKPDEISREECQRDKRLQDIINVEGSTTIRDRILRGAAQRSLAKDYIQDKPSKITEICDALKNGSTEFLKTILHPETASDSYSAYVDKHIQTEDEHEKKVATRSINTGLKRLVLDELFSQKLRLIQPRKTAVLSTVSSLPIKCFQYLRYEDIHGFINLILTDKSQITLDESHTTLPASLKITRDAIFELAPWCDQFDTCYHIFSKSSSDEQTPLLQQSRLHIDDLIIAEILTQVPHGNPEINDLRVEPSFVHRADLTDIQGDATQTTSRKRRGSTDTRQAGKRVKGGRPEQGRREAQQSSDDGQTQANTATGLPNSESNDSRAPQISDNDFPNSYDFGNSQQSFGGFPNSYDFGNFQQSFNGYPNSYDFGDSQQSFGGFPNSYDFGDSQQSFGGFPNSYDLGNSHQSYNTFPNLCDSDQLESNLNAMN